MNTDGWKQIPAWGICILDSVSVIAVPMMFHYGFSACVFFSSQSIQSNKGYTHDLIKAMAATSTQPLVYLWRVLCALASMWSHAHEYHAIVCISFNRYRLSAICIINTENELIFTTCPCVYIELCSRPGVYIHSVVLDLWLEYTCVV